MSVDDLNQIDKLVQGAEAQQIADGDKFIAAHPEVPVVDVAAAEAPRNPRSDAEGAHEELEPSIPIRTNLPDEPMNPHAAAPPSAPPAPIVQAVKHEGTGDSRDTSKLDSTGKEKGDPADPAHEPLHGSGPRGSNAPNESLDEEEKKLRDRLAEIRLQRGMSSTDKVDSIGNAQHVFKQEVQGHDKHGARIPDKSTGEIVEEAPAHIGPRGSGAPPDTFHGKRPPNARS